MGELKLKLFVFGLWSFLNNFFLNQWKDYKMNVFRIDCTADWKIPMHWGGSLFVIFLCKWPSLVIPIIIIMSYDQAWSLEWICVSFDIILVQHLFFQLWSLISLRTHAIIIQKEIQMFFLYLPWLLVSQVLSKVITIPQTTQTF